MKQILLSLALAATVFSASAKSAASDTTVVFKMDPETPMHCESCENRIKGDLRFVKGVKDIQTSLPEQTVTVKYKKTATNAQKIIEALDKIGYTATKQD
jgi:copper chaperone CopZ